MDRSELHSHIAEKESNICQIVVLKNGQTVYEDLWNGYRPDDALNVMSVTKSVVSLLIGIAIDRGLIKSVEQNVLDFFPEYTPKRGERTIREVRIEHLLTMTAPYKYRSEPWTKVCTSDDWTVAALDLLGGRAGITGEFKYSTLGVQILTGIIAQASGLKVIEFANRYLFEPLGAAPHRNKEDVSKEDQLNFLMSKLPKGDVWYADPRGVNTAGWGLALSARDMARIGQMCLERGTYEGKRVVSREWVDAMTTPRYQCGEQFDNMAYGYLWWIVDRAKGVYAAIGDGGNVIYVDRESKIVAAVTATFKPAVYDRVSFIQEHFDRAFGES